MPAMDWELNPPYGYVVSFIRLHERGFTALASRFMRGQCYHYGMELHNFAPNVISQVATFIGICEGFLGIPVNWYLWVHLFRVELHTLAMGETWVREGPIRRTREGGSEWEPIKILLEGDGNSNKMNTASNTSLRLTTQVGQAHVATGVPLDLGTNTQPSDPRTQRNTKPRV
jgi:hypothetical protein